MIRAIRNRYLPRSAGRIGPQVLVNARRAAATARSTSASLPLETSVRTSSVAGLTVLNGSPEPSTNSPSTNSPYEGLMSTIERDSGAGAYSNRLRRVGLGGAVVMWGQSTVT